VPKSLINKTTVVQGQQINY